MLSSKSIEFKCPSHECSGTSIEEIQTDVTVISEVEELELFNDGSVQHRYGDQTNEGGHVLQYQCQSCGYVIVDDNSGFSDDGLDEHALVKAIEALNAKKNAEGPRGEVVGFPILLNQIKDVHDALDGEELAEVFNSLFPSQQVKYIGDSMFEAIE